MTHDENPAYRAVLFDLDGTLLDTAPDFVTALNRMLAQRGQDLLDPHLIRAGVTHGSAGLISLAFGLRADSPDFEPLRQEFLGYYQDCLSQQTRLFPGLEQLLTKFARQDIPWGIVTNKPELYTRAILSDLKLPSAPRTVICPDHVSRTKPDPEPGLLACRELNIAPAEALYVGDHLRDIQAGLNAGCYTVSAAYGYIGGDDDPRDWGAHFLITDPAQLDAIVFAR